MQPLTLGRPFSPLFCCQWDSMCRTAEAYCKQCFSDMSPGHQHPCPGLQEPLLPSESFGCRLLPKSSEAKSRGFQV
jgi:hypothetical protein